jgi:transcriptional regulator with XRE-family HTH domain
MIQQIRKSVPQDGNNEIKDPVRDKLIAVRKSKKIKQNSIAEHIGITKSALSRYETGKTVMGFNKVQKYAEYLDLEIRLLIK